MADGRQRDAWNHTAALMALTANCHRDPKRKSTPFEPNDFHPMTANVRRKPDAMVSIKALKGLFTGEPTDFDLLEPGLQAGSSSEDRPEHDPHPSIPDPP